MSYEEEIVKYLATLQVGEILSRKQIIEGVHNLYGRNKSSIIPSDYCYNIVNYDIRAHDFEKVTRDCWNGLNVVSIDI